ncbi:diacylglycerol kinase family protein [Mucilaginibacter paludis]|uniref:Diacylglycerol kinase n=1 Tax=Mucilaginibacter paludis DSM 18603 TaxID=714943 RepID=H1YBJ0_9SPHI|nr:diacylglycerol kinase family protein [Mucilaginibacter paludis]EHQ25061.1 diacylglycerol kinase [Mucilaginibacter paludis DSM 18603]
MRCTSRIKEHLASYRHAIRGIVMAFRYEHSMTFHFAAAAAVVVVNSLLKVNQTEWLITLMLIGLAWTAEVFNTAIEKLADRISKEQDPLIGQAKDLASAAVLIICLFSVLCAIIIYFPYLSKKI